MVRRSAASLLPYLPLFLQVAVSQTTSIDYCQALVEVITICEAETASFTQLPASIQASCYCGSTIGTLAWGPAAFDTLAADCASQYATLDATIASDARVLESFCTAFGAPAQTDSEAGGTSTTALGGGGGVTATPQNTVSCVLWFTRIVCGAMGGLNKLGTSRSRLRFQQRRPCKIRP